ncbi:uncharacterized protein LOC144581672 [Callithrix jacchus]
MILEDGAVGPTQDLPLPVNPQRGGTHRTGRVPHAQPHPESSIRLAWGRPFPRNPGQRFKSPPGEAEFPSASAQDCRHRASSRPASLTSRRPRRLRAAVPQAAPAAGDTRRSGALIRRGTASQPARPPASSLTREAAAASPLWLLSGFRTQAPTAATSTIPAADAGTARPPSRVPSAPEGAPRSPHRAPPPAAAVPAAMARSAGRALSTARLPRSPECRVAAAAAAAAGRAGARARQLPGSAAAGADAVTGQLCGLPRRPRTPPSAPPLPPAAAAADSAFGGGRACGRQPGAGRACPDAG